MRQPTQTQKSPAQDCENLLHTVRLTSAYAQPQVRTCVDCGAEVLLDIQVYPVWLTEALRDVVLDRDGHPVLNRETQRPMTVYGIGFAEDRRGRNWERLRPHYEAHHPEFQGEGSNTRDDTEE